MIKNVHWFSCKVNFILLPAHIFEEFPNIKFHENPSGGSRVVLCGRTDMTKLTDNFRNFANVPKSVLNIKHNGNARSNLYSSADDT
jgi:hypothetical protein